MSVALTNNFDNKCRICLQLHHQMKSFFDVYFEGISLATIFSNITSCEIRDDDHMPKMICEECENTIVTFNNLLTVFQETQLFLKTEIFKNDVKYENNEYYEDDIKDACINQSDLDDNECLGADFNTSDVKSEAEDDIGKTEKIGEHWGKKQFTQNGKESCVNGEYKLTKSFKYTCECGDCFLHKSGFRQHVQSRHNKLLEEADLVNYSEEIILKIPMGFPNNIEYVFPKTVIRKNKLQCRICSSRFLTEEEVKTHEQIHKTFICDHCGSAFLKKHYLTDHVRTHSEERNYNCKICLKTFKHRYSYNVHKKLHDGSRNFVCDTCGADFKTAPTLRTHVKIRHSDVRNYQCPNCDLKFNLRSTLNKHLLRKHTPDRKKSFVCTACGAAYLNKNTLTRHISAKHLGKAKNYPCTICENRVFTEKKSLKAHVLKKHLVSLE